ncbi:MAG: hypothetical protein JJT89_15975, partial [Nitriliruptoraceae bacterium]|nr:hypothetical protein [Nitriliruptoraceae bacterium]
MASRSRRLLGSVALTGALLLAPTAAFADGPSDDSSPGEPATQGARAVEDGATSRTWGARAAPPRPAARPAP